MQLLRRYILISWLAFIMFQTPHWVKTTPIVQPEAKTSSGGIVEVAEAREPMSVPQGDIFQVYFGDKAEQARRIAQCESGMNEKAIGINKNGSRDFGLMQINSLWLKVYDITPELLLIADNNLKVAKNIYDRTGNFNAWVCANKLGY